MPYCSRCGVEVEANKDNCPLCGTAIQKLDEEPPKQEKKYPEEPVEKKVKAQRTAKEKRLLIWEIVSIVLLIPTLITLFINLIVQGTVSWALYPISTLVLTWLLVTFPLLFPKKPIIMIIGEVLPLSVFLLVVDIIANQRIDWYLRLALPNLALIVVVVISVVIASLKVKNKGLNIVAFVLFGIGLICLGLDLIITSYIQKHLAIEWSLYVLVPTVLVGGFFIYLHFRLTKKVDIKRKIQI
jgi:hypothetical protein